MLYGNHFSHYRAENILQTPTRPAHSGPELCYATPDSVLADKLAHEVVSNGISVVDLKSDASSSWSGGSVQGIKLGLR